MADVDLVIWMPDDKVWLVPSRTEGEGMRTVDTIVAEGVTVLVCDCPGSYLGHYLCWHIKAVVEWMRRNERRQDDCDTSEHRGQAAIDPRGCGGTEQ